MPDDDPFESKWLTRFALGIAILLIVLAVVAFVLGILVATHYVWGRP